MFVSASNNSSPISGAGRRSAASRHNSGAASRTGSRCGFYEAPFRRERFHGKIFIQL
jgi:hypothetical protein